MPYQMKPAPSHLSKSQKKDWDMNEKARYDASLKQDNRSMDKIAPEVKSGSDVAPKSASATAKNGESRQSEAERAVQEAKKMHNKGYGVKK